MENVTLGMILEARERLKKVVHNTGLLSSKMLSGPGRNVFFKTECLQHTGSFKLRGAYNMIAQLSEEERKAGVIASSAGNHAQGVAYAAQAYGTKATIVMPEGAPLAKIASTRHYGAEVVLHGAVYDDAYAKAKELRDQTGATFVHPFNDPHVIAGQGTIALEILDSLDQVDAVLVPIGGGGLIAGIACAIKALSPKTRVIGVEAATAACMRESIHKGGIIRLDSARTIADGIAVKEPGDLTYALCSKYVDEIVTVEEDEIAQAILVLLERCKVVAEGAGAVPAAALLSGKVDVSGNVVALVSGGNIDVTTLQRILDRGLVKEGRLGRITTMLVDRPGHLHQLLKLVASAGANIMSIQHDRVDSMTGMGMARLVLTVETNNRQHFELVCKMVEEGGYTLV